VSAEGLAVAEQLKTYTPIGSVKVLIVDSVVVADATLELWKLYR
jgi:hypothetical protein